MARGYNAKLRAKREANNLCNRCGKPNDTDKYYCSECTDKRNSEQAGDRKFYIDLGICPICRKVPILGDEAACPECRAKHAETESRRRQTEQAKNYAKKHNKDIYYKRKEIGICYRCGKRKTMPGKGACGICLQSKNKYYSMKYKRPLRSDAICRFCDNPVEQGFKVCEYHHQELINRARSERAIESRQKLRKDGILH